MQLRLSIFAVSLLYLLACSASRADDLQTLATDFWTWRAAEQPVSTDDIPRLERPAHWVPSWSPESVQSYRTKLGEFESRWLKLDVASLPIAQQVDYRLMGSAIARVRCELDVNRGWQRNPGFYIDQTVGAYFHLLLPPPPFDSYDAHSGQNELERHTCSVCLLGSRSARKHPFVIATVGNRSETKT
jgi:hypothetical protein